MRKKLSIVLCIAMIIMAIPYNASASYIEGGNVNGNKAKVLISKGEGIQKLLMTDEEVVNKSVNESFNDITFSMKEKKDQKLKDDKNEKAKDKKKDEVSVKMNGSFDLNGIKCDVNAEGEAEIYDSSKLGKIYLGELKGEILIGEEKRDICVSYEKNNDNIYYAITINDLSDSEGYCILTFGESLLDVSVLEELGILKKSQDIDPNVTTKGYDSVDYDWVELDDYPNGNVVLFNRLYLEDDIAVGGGDGKILVKTQVDKSDVVEELENNNSYTILLVIVENFIVDFQSTDEESYFNAHSPEETDTDNQVFNFILGAMGDIPGVSSTLLSVIESVGSSIGNEVTLLNNYMYRVRFDIEPEDDTYMDWSEYIDGGYPVLVGIHKDTNATDDDIDVYSDATLRVFLNQDQQHFLVDTGQSHVRVDLANY